MKIKISVTKLLNYTISQYLSESKNHVLLIVDHTFVLIIIHEF